MWYITTAKYSTMPATNSKLTTESFTNHPKVTESLAQLKAAFNGEGKKPFIVSDVLDEEGHQYVNLVQKGGGVLGVALVGYTYVLEQMGIRFLRLAGTSAGAINTSLMTVIGKKTEAKSPKILEAICALNFFNLVDGHPAARWLIKRFITHQDFTARARKVFGIVLGILALLFVADIVLFGLQHKWPVLEVYAKLSFILTGFYLLLLGTAGAYIAGLLKRLKNSGFGINPGDYFYDWIKQQLADNGVHTVDDLNNKAGEAIPGLHLRPGITSPEGLNGLLKGDVTFITSELVTQNKIELPKMCNLFRPAAEINKLPPAGFIRASMSIPVFFESYYINDIPCNHPDILKSWEDTFGEAKPPTKARFVDGGILSNFPINLFYNGNVARPRLPSFGIDLDDTKPGEKEEDAAAWTLAGYAGRMFNTIRFYYDKDFQIKNKVFKKGVGSIPLWQYNWLNFFLTDQDKIDMFVAGAEAATKFLLGFDWEHYKNDREFMQQELLKNKKGK